MEHILTFSLEVPVRRERVFEFFADAENLQAVTPVGLRFETLTSRPISLHKGALIVYRFRLFGIPFGVQTRIVEWDPPIRFVDEQRRGPFVLWIHTHTFDETSSGTMIRDHVRYQLPMSPFGELAQPLVRKQLESIFQYRQEAVPRILMRKVAGG